MAQRADLASAYIKLGSGRGRKIVEEGGMALTLATLPDAKRSGIHDSRSGTTDQ